MAILTTTSGAAEKPNVVFILADDLGWSDTTLFGTTSYYRTPNIERLAKRGMTFTQAYSSSPLCSPTRASVLTGLSPARTGITAPNCHLPTVVLQATTTATGGSNQKSTTPQSVTRLSTSYYTLAEMFKDNGYATGHFGKWHLGPTPYSPLEHGFDVDIPHWAGPGPAGSFVAPWKYPDFDPQTPDEHIEDRMAQEATAFMKANKDRPFFLNYWMFSVHAPFDAKPNLIEEYHQRTDPSNPQRCPVYAAMIESMDDAVGTLLDSLDQLGIADNTIVIFASDNGGNMYNDVEGTTVTSNLPLRGGKATMYEGGIRGPAIVVYPGKVDAETRSDQIIQSCDYYPTLLDLLNVKAQPNQSFDGISIVPALKGMPLDRDAIFTYFPHNPPVPEWLPPSVSVHQGDWKLIRIFHGGENGKHRYKLFNLKDDIGEQTNLAEQMPDQVTKLDSLIEAFLIDTNAARPLANPNFDPASYHPEQEGIGRLKGGANAPKGPAKKKVSKPVAGWQPGGTATLKLKKGQLIVSSTGSDPYLSYPLPKPAPAGKLTLHVAMKSDAAGRGQIFWQEQGAKPPFAADRSLFFDVNHDGQSHEYAVTFSAAAPVESIRIDPARAAGAIGISAVRLTSHNGAELLNWKAD